jgi:hypothetical protein
VGGDQPSPLPPAAHKRRQADADARESPEAAEPWLAASRGADDQTADTWEWSESAEARPERPLPSPDIFLPAATEPRLQTSTQIGLKHERPGIPPFVPDSLVRLTLAGGWLLGLPDCGAPAFAVAPPCRADHVTPDLLLVPPSAAPLHLARLAPLCRWLPPQFPALDQRLQLDPERVGQAVAQGTSLPQILHDLAEALAQPIGRRQADRLRAWARAGQQVRVRQLTVLETADAELMGRLRSRKLVRRHLGEAISPTRAALNPAGLPALAETLRHLGLYVALPPAASDQPDLPAMCLPATYLALSEVPDTSTPRPQIRLEPAEAGMLWLAGLVYVGLGEHLALPAPLSPVVFDTLAGQLSAAQQQAARHLAQQALEAVAATLRGYLGLPAWQMPGDQADVLPLIEQALAARQDLLLTYFGAGREQPVVRRVTPYWLERRGGVPYLIAYCHLREAERVFRVDRITECRPVTG